MYEDEEYLQNRVHELIEEVGAIRLEEAMDTGLSGVLGVVSVLACMLFAGMWYSGTLVFFGVFAPNTPFEAHVLWFVAANLCVTMTVTVAVSVSGLPGQKMSRRIWVMIWAIIHLPLAGMVPFWVEHPKMGAIMPILITMVLFAGHLTFTCLMAMHGILCGYARKQWYARRIRAKKERLESAKADLDREIQIQTAAFETHRIDRGREEPRVLN